jgi:hypothetical protein
MNENLNKNETVNEANKPACFLGAVSGSLAKQETLKEILNYIDSFHGSGHDYWWINSKVRDKVYWMLERSKANDR